MAVVSRNSFALAFTVISYFYRTTLLIGMASYLLDLASTCMQLKLNIPDALGCEPT